MAAKIIKNEHRVTVAKLRMGSGKSFIAAIIANYYRKKEKRVAIVVPQTFLVSQMNKMLGSLRHSIKVMTMQSTLFKSKDYDVFIIDEADQCILELGSTIDTAKSMVFGYWDLLTKRSILLTATISKDLEDILFEVFGFKTPA